MLKQLIHSLSPTKKRKNPFELLEQRNQFHKHLQVSTTILTLHKKKGMHPKQIARKLEVPYKQVTQTLKEYSA